MSIISLYANTGVGEASGGGAHEPSGEVKVPVLQHGRGFVRVREVWLQCVRDAYVQRFVPARPRFLIQGASPG